MGAFTQTATYTLTAPFTRGRGWEINLLRLKTAAYIMLMVVLGWAPRAAAQLPGVQLIVTPPTISFPRITGDMRVVDAPPLTVQVVAPGQRPWRLMVTAVGPLQSGEGAEIPNEQVSWQAGPSPAFVNGTLSSGQPQAEGLAQGAQWWGRRGFVLRIVGAMPQATIP